MRNNAIKKSMTKKIIARGEKVLVSDSSGHFNTGEKSMSMSAML